MAGALKAAGEYTDILGKDNFFLEVHDHRLPEQRKVNALLPDLSRKTGLPLVASNDIHYLKKEHAPAHEVLLCLQTQTVLTDPKHMRLQTDEFYMKSPDEMIELFKDFPGATDRTLEIAERCNLEIEFGRLHFPIFKVPEGTSQKKYLSQLALKGLATRYNIKDPEHPADEREKELLARFHLELDIIEKTGFINYFLVVWDFVRFAHDSHIPVGPGRGSGGGSMVAYALGITAIDPIRYELIFERFLNPERVSPPDFDIDFCQARRGEVIEYVKQKYGRDNVAQIITFGSLGAKTVIRDVGRVLEVPFGECDRLAKMVPDDPKISLKSALEMNPDLRKAHEGEPTCKRILDFGFVLEGLHRNAGTHAAGVVIGEGPLVDIIPLSRDKEKEVITQYSMEPLGEIGLLKMDFLGLKTLTVIQETIDLVKKTRGIELDIDAFPMDDKPAYALLNRGDTVGVFQLESSGMRDLIRRVGIDKIEDLIAMIALYRPGPMNMLEDYVNRKTGKAKVHYEHKLVEPILAETYGVMVYQEQVQKVANVLAGYSLGAADILRRAMGKKKREVMEAERAKFVEGCHKRNKIPAKLAESIFDNMERFAGYGFNKAHSAGYGVITYQTAYLKANYTAEFMAALLSSEMGNMDKLPVFIGEAQEMGLEILPPDINHSGVRFTPMDDGKGIRFGLAGIKNVGEGAAEAVVAERTRGGPFAGLVEFCSRVDGQLANKKVAESLIRCGAFDSVKVHRARLFKAVDFAMSRAAAAARDKRSGQRNLFELMSSSTPGMAPTEELPDCPPWPASEMLAGERELLGIYLSGHPLTQFASLLKRYQLTTVQGIAQLQDKAVTRLGGIVSMSVKRFTKKKEPMAVFRLEDLDGSLEVVVFPEAYQNYGMYVQDDRPIMVCGEVSKSEEPARMFAQELYPLADAPKHFAVRVGVHVPVSHLDNGKLERVRAILEAHPGVTPVVICLQFPAGEKVFLNTENKYRVLADEDLIRKLEQELGEKGIYVAVNTNPCLKPKTQRKNWSKDNSE
jgi:DNA polymerase-3 subunit alpha